MKCFNLCAYRNEQSGGGLPTFVVEPLTVESETPLEAPITLKSEAELKRFLKPLTEAGFLPHSFLRDVSEGKRPCEKVSVEAYQRTLAAYLRPDGGEDRRPAEDWG